MRTKTKWIAGGAFAATLLAGATGVALGATDQSEDAPLTGQAFEEATAAALADVGGGSVVGAESDDGGFEVEIRREDGTTVDVTLDRDFEVLRREVDGPDDDDDADEQVTADERERASAAALAATGGGAVNDVERDDDGSYEVEVITDDGREIDVRLDAELTVVGTPTEDRE